MFPAGVVVAVPTRDTPELATVATSVRYLSKSDTDGFAPLARATGVDGWRALGRSMHPLRIGNNHELQAYECPAVIKDDPGRDREVCGRALPIERSGHVVVVRARR